MRQVLYRKFGGLDVLELAEVAAPTPAAGEVLVRVKAAAINPADWKMREGDLKLLSGWRMPQGQGLEFAGVVEQVGPGVTGYTVGDEVFGEGRGCIAERCVAKVERIAKKPPGVSFEAASTLACAGTTAESAFRDQRIRAGATVLVNGATGGIGMFATQWAIRRGAIVTAVVSEKGAALAERWGAARVVNYRQTNILDEGRTYDVVIELSDKLSFSRARPIVAAGGTFFASLPNPAEFVPGFLGNLVSSRRYALLGMRAKTDTLGAVARDVAEGVVEVVVGKTFALEEFREAYAQTAAAKHPGKTVVVVSG